MKKTINILFILLLGAVTFFWGCKDTVTADKLDSIVIPSSNVSYAKYIQPVLNLKCTNCHGNGQVDGGVNLTSWSNTTADPNVVFPGKPDNSSLVWAIEGKPGVYIMPPPSSPYKPLTNNQVQGVITWIKEGAKDN